ncbi:GntR family transcriptional regulator [Prosthecomicrobium sp. N25]|uniref:GntR family transcriptional regulator n=1 Tax=Prosthecomicrobium sp. N25 TaxID=3129254 RepID=UPI003077F2C9
MSDSTAGRHSEPLPSLGARRVLLTQTIADTIAEAIAAKRLGPGARIVESVAAGELGVSRVPLREALKVLHAQGILTGEGHKGYRVAVFDRRHARHVFETRLALETLLLRGALARWREGSATMEGLDEAIRRMEGAAAAGNASASLRADLDFHRWICRSADNAFVATLWNAIERHILIIFSDERYRDGDLAAVAQHHAQFRDRIVAMVRGAPASETSIRNALAGHLFLAAGDASNSE